MGLHDGRQREARLQELLAARGLFSFSEIDNLSTREVRLIIVCTGRFWQRSN